MQQKKKFTFPKNVDTSYAIVAGLSGKDIICYILPPFFLCVLIGIIPPFNSVALWIVKIFFFVVLMIGGFIFALVRPVKDRPNIRLIDYIKQYRDFGKRQRIFYLAKKEKGFKDAKNNQ